jgi:hypothetical protein
MDSESFFSFSSDGPFFPMVAAFLLSTVGLGPVYESNNPLHLSAERVAWYRGLVEAELRIDLEQIRQLTQHLPSDRAVQELCGMLIISAHAVALDHGAKSRRILESAKFEFFRHVRNAAAHGNRFTFGHREPRRRAEWRNITIDRANHSGTQCFGRLLNSADALALLDDIQKELTALPS